MPKRLCYGLRHGTTDARQNSLDCLVAKHSEFERVGRVLGVDSDFPGDQSVAVAWEDMGRIPGWNLVVKKMSSVVHPRWTAMTLASRVVMVGVV